MSLKFVPNGPLNNIPVLFQIMAWCRTGDKVLSEPMMVRLLTHIYASLGPMAQLTIVCRITQTIFSSLSLEYINICQGIVQTQKQVTWHTMAMLQYQLDVASVKAGLRRVCEC